MSIYLYGGYGNFKLLKVEFRSRKSGHEYVHTITLDNNELVTEDNVEVWSRYLEGKIASLVTPEAMQSDEYQQIAERFRVEEERNAKWQAGAAERAKREKHRKQLRRTNTLGFIPDGLTVDYVEEYGRYVENAIQWNPEDSDDFLYQLRSLERMAVKCAARCMENRRPDAAWEQTYAVCLGIPKWKSRKDLQVYFNQYKPRLRKFVKSMYTSLVDAAIAWNHAEKLAETNRLVVMQAKEYVDWGMAEKKMLELQRSITISGKPIEVERTPSRMEQYQITQEKLRKEAEERRKAEEEAERNSLIPVNRSLEKALFIDRSLNWECSFIGYGIDEQGKQVDALLDAGMTHDAIVLFLQIVKYMCKHFISEEHWCMFDDVYDPDYSCELILGSLNKAAHAGNLSTSDKEYFHKAWEEIQAMEACQQYGIANYKIEF